MVTIANEQWRVIFNYRPFFIFEINVCFNYFKASNPPPYYHLSFQGPKDFYSSLTLRMKQTLER